jgi:membrane protein implicated in regulation of membrane protease activity
VAQDEPLTLRAAVVPQPTGELRRGVLPCAVRTRTLRLGIALCTVLAVVGSALVYWYSFHPFPTGAKAVVAMLFFAVVLGLVALYCAPRLRRPAVLDLVGAGDRDDEPVGERA